MKLININIDKLNRRPLRKMIRVYKYEYNAKMVNENKQNLE